jgi:hypothetical protein
MRVHSRAAIVFLPISTKLDVRTDFYPYEMTDIEDSVCEKPTPCTLDMMTHRQSWGEEKELAVSAGAISWEVISAGTVRVSVGVERLWTVGVFARARPLAGNGFVDKSGRN